MISPELWEVVKTVGLGIGICIAINTMLLGIVVWVIRKRDEK